MGFRELARVLWRRVRPPKPKLLQADYAQWARTWEHRRDRWDYLAEGQPYFNRRTGAFLWDTVDTGSDEAYLAIGPSWPGADYEQVPPMADQAAAEAWLRERGFVVPWPRL